MTPIDSTPRPAPRGVQKTGDANDVVLDANANAEKEPLIGRQPPETAAASSLPSGRTALPAPDPLPTARPPLEEIGLDLMTLVAFAQRALMQSEQETHHEALKRSLNEQKDMLQSAKKVYDLDMKAAEKDYQAAMSGAAAEMAAGAVQMGFSAKAGLDLKTSTSMSSKANKANKKTEKLQKDLHAAQITTKRDISELTNHQKNHIAGVKGADSEIKRLEIESRQLHADEAELESMKAMKIRMEDRLQENTPEFATLRTAINEKRLSITGRRGHEAINQDINTHKQLRVQEEAHISQRSEQIHQKQSDFEDFKSETDVKLTKQQHKAHDANAQGEWKTKASMAWGQLGQAVAQITNSQGKIAAAAYSFDAAGDRADAKLEGVEQELHSSRYQMFLNFADQQQNALKTTMDSYSSISQGTQSTLDAMARNFG